MKKALIISLLVFILCMVGCSKDIGLTTESYYIAFEYLNEDANINNIEGYIFREYDEFEKYSKRTFKNPEHLNVSESINFNDNNLLLLTMEIENPEIGLVYKLEKIKADDNKLKVYLNYIDSVARKEHKHKSLVQTVSWIVKLDKDITAKEVVVIKK